MAPSENTFVKESDQCRLKWLLNCLLNALHISYELQKCEESEADVKQHKTQSEEWQKTHEDAVKMLETKHGEEVKIMKENFKKVVFQVHFVPNTSNYVNKVIGF